MESMTHSKGKLAFLFKCNRAQKSDFLRNRAGFSQLGKRSSHQCHTGCLEVALEVLERFRIEAGAHHGWNPSRTGGRQLVK